MNEDDTFNRLSRPSYSEVDRLFTEWVSETAGLPYTKGWHKVFTEEMVLFFEKHHWTVTEYNKSYNEYIDNESR